MFRFTIRDVLWLTVVVGLAVSWWLHAGRMQLEGKAVELAAKRSAAKAQGRADLTARLLKIIVAQREAERVAAQKALDDARKPAFEAAIKARVQKRFEDMEHLEDATRVERLQRKGYLPAHAAPRIQSPPSGQLKNDSE